MPGHIVQAVAEKAPRDIPLQAPGSQRQRLASGLRAAWCLLRYWWPTLSPRPPEMHAIDYLAKDHTRAFL
jgi:hypothetical protein